MPVSRGRGGRKRPNKSRRKGRADYSQPIAKPGSQTEAELSTVAFIATAMGSLPIQPSCPGPLLVHANGAFECHGAGCPGGINIHHSADAIDPCHTRPEIRVRNACSRCLTHADNAQMSEHACSGQQIEHDDGAIECSSGDACLGDEALHLSSQSCRFSGPCPRNCQPAV